MGKSEHTFFFSSCILWAKSVRTGTFDILYLILLVHPKTIDIANKIKSINEYYLSERMLKH